MFSSLFSRIFFPVLKRADSYYYVTSGLLVILMVLLWKISKYIKRFAEFPQFPLMYYLVYSIVMKRIPKDLPFAAFSFQKLIQLGQRFQKEKLYLIWMPNPFLFVFSEDIVKAAYENDSLEKTKNYALLKIVFGNGLLTSDVDTWRVHRKLLNPVFYVGMLKKKMPIFNENANILVKKLEVETMSGTPVDVIEFLKPCAFGILCEYVLGLRMNTEEDKDAIQSYLNAVTLGSDVLVKVMGQPWLQFAFTRQFFPSGRQYKTLSNRINNFTKETLSSIKKEIISRKADEAMHDSDWKNDQEDRKSFAHIMLDHHLKDNSFTMDDVESQVSTFMLAGFDTVSYAILWVLFLLGHHPDVQDQVYNEVEALSDRNINYEDLYKLQYLECVIKETLRIYPVIPVFARKLNKDMKYEKYIVPKGTGIVFFPYTLHRDPKVYPDPEKFDPNRFQDGNSTIRSENYIPFGKGIRNCIGKTFAMIEMKVILAYILRNFKIASLEKREDVDLTWNVVMAPVRPLLFQLTPREEL